MIESSFYGLWRERWRFTKLRNVPIPSIVCLSSLGDIDPLILDELTLLTNDTMITKSNEL